MDYEKMARELSELLKQYPPQVAKIGELPEGGMMTEAK